MSRSAARFTESDVRRVLTAARKAECVVRIEIEKSGKLVIMTGIQPGEAPTDESNSWDKAIADLETDNATSLRAIFR
jgi:hypothetical protein